MTDKQLSPAAQAVLDAFLGDAENTGLQMDDLRENVADAIRAVVEHCVPDDSEGHWVYIPHVLAIANELEAK
jgi:hypothetical protein